MLPAGNQRRIVSSAAAVGTTRVWNSVDGWCGCGSCSSCRQDQSLCTHIIIAIIGDVVIAGWPARYFTAPTCSHIPRSTPTHTSQPAPAICRRFYFDAEEVL